ncbi:MAG: hypothetical protein JW720_11630 [Sedimentisphaerales bacterium]|nr:hypothetical protein [Sedimentisphaerales bacterium]
MIDSEQRHRRLRRLTKQLNRERKQQAKKIDILCNDVITAHRDFIRKLNVISFTAAFYETIIGAIDLNSLLYSTIGLIKEEISDANITFFLKQAENFELHIFESAKPVTLGKQHLENCFNPELMDSICSSNRICTLDDMLGMGFQGNPTGLNRISAVTVPLGRTGFVLIYRSSMAPITADELSNISAVASGLSKAIQSCRELLHPAE